MKNNPVKRERMSSLERGKIRNVGLFERTALKVTGFFDGRRSLPREDGNGVWTSPHLDREAHSYDEFTSRVYGKLQIENEDNFGRLGELMDSVRRTQKELADARADLAAQDALYNAEAVRRHGEAKLTEAQVKARRMREKEKELMTVKSRISSLEKQLDQQSEEFLKLYNKLIEEINSTKMICNRAKDHLYQRMAVYWDASMRRNPSKSQMPVTPQIEIENRSETNYMNLHQALLEQGAKFSVMLNEKNNEREAA